MVETTGRVATAIADVQTEKDRTMFCLLTCFWVYYVAVS